MGAHDPLPDRFEAKTDLSNNPVARALDTTDSYREPQAELQALQEKHERVSIEYDGCKQMLSSSRHQVRDLQDLLNIERERRREYIHETDVHYTDLESAKLNLSTKYSTAAFFTCNLEMEEAAIAKLVRGRVRRMTGV
ncbi:hypothetical protein Aduo_016205 [Ancylostoma duodenale]